MQYMRAARFFVVVLFASALIGCETNVEPLIGEERPYTLWGIFNASADTQRVRVFPIAESPGISRPGEIDATVTSTDLTTGETRVWNHERVTYEDGEVGHVFWSAFQAQNGHRYQLEVARSDGETSSATVTIPDNIEVTVERTETSPKAFVYVRGDISNLIGVEMRYEATNLPPLYVYPPERPLAPQVFFPVEIPYGERGERIPDGWRFDVDMMEDFEAVRDAFHLNCLVTSGAPGIALRRVEFHFIAADEAWNPPGGEFDPEVLVEPGAMSNVENGYGFVGGGVVVAERWTPSSAVRRHIGYSEEQPCSSQPSPTPACMEPPIPCLGDNPDSIWDRYF